VERLMIVKVGQNEVGWLALNERHFGLIFMVGNWERQKF
jgi:hypothetical protein